MGMLGSVPNVLMHYSILSALVIVIIHILLHLHHSCRPCCCPLPLKVQAPLLPPPPGHPPPSEWLFRQTRIYNEYGRYKLCNFVLELGSTRLHGKYTSPPPPIPPPSSLFPIVGIYNSCLPAISVSDPPVNLSPGGESRLASS